VHAVAAAAGVVAPAPDRLTSRGVAPPAERPSTVPDDNDDNDDDDDDSKRFADPYTTLGPARGTIAFSDARAAEDGETNRGRISGRSNTGGFIVVVAVAVGFRHGPPGSPTRPCCSCETRSPARRSSFTSRFFYTWSVRTVFRALRENTVLPLLPPLLSV